MPDTMWTSLVATLREYDIEFDAGLTDAEVEAVEGRYRFRFPPDLRAFLQAGLPCGERFPNWRSGAEDQLREWLDRPRQGILFDIEYNGFWLTEWGPRPATLAEAQEIATKLIAAAPTLIPVYANLFAIRMMPSEPHLAGNPVFSVHQTDIIYYAIDLRDYLIHQFLTREDVDFWPIPDNIRKIPFWDIDRFQEVRWGQDGSCVFDNRRGILP